MRDGAERARPRRVIVKNILYQCQRKYCETSDCVNCGERLVGDNVRRYVVHARWLAVPASQDPVVAGTRQQGEKQEKKMNTAEKTWMFPCFVNGPRRLPIGSASSTHVVPWFLHGQRMRPSPPHWFSFGSAAGDPLSSVNYSHLKTQLVTGRTGKNMLSCMALSLFDDGS